MTVRELKNILNNLPDNLNNAKVIMDFGDENLRQVYSAEPECKRISKLFNVYDDFLILR